MFEYNKRVTELRLFQIDNGEKLDYNRINIKKVGKSWRLVRHRR